MAKTFRVYESSPRTVECRGCRAPIRWFDTLTGKRMPVEAAAAPLSSSNDGPRVILVFDAAASHWATCPQSAAFRGGPR